LHRLADDSLSLTHPIGIFFQALELLDARCNGCGARYLSFAADVRPVTGESCGCIQRLEALEASLDELRRDLAAIDLADLRHTAMRMRELLLDVAEQIDEALTTA
jgi:hypothetical protein